MASWMVNWLSGWNTKQGELRLTEDLTIDAADLKLIDVLENMSDHLVFPT